MDTNPEARAGQERPIEYLTEPTDSIEHLFFMAEEAGLRPYKSGSTELHTNAPLPELFGFHGAFLEVRPMIPLPREVVNIDHGGWTAFESDAVIVAEGFKFTINNGQFAIEVWTPPRPSEENLDERIYEKCFIRLGTAHFRVFRTATNTPEEARVSVPTNLPRRRGFK